MFDYEIDQQVYNAAIQNGASDMLAKMVTAQARFESGDYNSNQTKVNNNLFGFKYSKNSKYSQIGNISPEGDPYAHYNSIADCTSDYFARWWHLPSNDNDGTRLQDFNDSIQDANDTDTYATMLKGYGYYTNQSGETTQDSINNYANGLSSKLNKIKVVEFVNQNSTAIIVVVSIGIAYYIYWLHKHKIVK